MTLNLTNVHNSSKEYQIAIPIIIVNNIVLAYI